MLKFLLAYAAIALCSVCLAAVLAGEAGEGWRHLCVYGGLLSVLGLSVELVVGGGIR